MPRGGAALSVKEVVGPPIVSHPPERNSETSTSSTPIAWRTRILGMGDVLTLIEKAEANLDREQAEVPSTVCQQGHFRPRGLPRSRCSRSRRWGPLSGLVGMIPGLPKELRNAEIDDGCWARSRPSSDP